MIKQVNNETEMKALGASIGKLVQGGQVIELVGDVGTGKTTFVKGLAKGMSVNDEVQSPSFTINRVYDSPSGIRLTHYDFYRLSEAGIMSCELQEDISDQNTVTVIEWGGVVDGVLPEDRLTVNIEAPSENSRKLTFLAKGNRSKQLLERLGR